jgi:endonuclease YncB( thermonuclease family)
MGRGRRKSKIEELFGGGRRASRRPAEPLSFRDDRKIPIWRSYLPFLTGAAAFGVMVGLVPGVWPNAEGGLPDQPIGWNEVQPAPQAERRAEDEEWARRAEAVEASAGSASGSGGAGEVRARFGLCPVGGGRDCVVDGDTIWLAGQNIRIADIDAPETHEPGCSAEKRLGDQATRRLHELVNSGTVSLKGIGRDSDSYGRKLRIVLVDGRSVGDTLVEEGLARWYKGGRRGWCA